MKILDKSWETWIIDNLTRQCTPKSILDVMLEHGFSHEIAFNAITAANDQQNITELLHGSSNGIPALINELPAIATNSNEFKISMRFKNPEVVVLDDFLTSNECDLIIKTATADLKPSVVVGVESSESQTHYSRTSEGMSFGRGESVLIQNIESRISALTNYPIDCGEGIQVLHYQKGAEYRPHFDYFNSSTVGGQKHMSKGGQRVSTLIMYLNDVEDGGETIFPQIGLSVFPKKGSALFFSNVNSEGAINPLTLHGGAPVVKGEKWIATKWLRQYKY